MDWLQESGEDSDSISNSSINSDTKLSSTSSVSIKCAGETMSNQDFSINKAEDFDNYSNKNSSEKRKSKETPNTSLKRDQEDIKFDENDILNRSETTLSDRCSSSSKKLEKTQNNNIDFHYSNNKSISYETVVNPMTNNRIFESSSMNEQIELTYSEPKKLREATENNVTTFTEEQRRDIIDEVYNCTWHNLKNYVKTKDKYEVTHNMYGLFKRMRKKTKL